MGAKGDILCIHRYDKTGELTDCDTNFVPSDYIETRITDLKETMLQQEERERFGYSTKTNVITPARRALMPRRTVKHICEYTDEEDTGEMFSLSPQALDEALFRDAERLIDEYFSSNKHKLRYIPKMDNNYLGSGFAPRNGLKTVEASYPRLWEISAIKNFAMVHYGVIPKKNDPYESSAEKTAKEMKAKSAKYDNKK